MAARRGRGSGSAGSRGSGGKKTAPFSREGIKQLAADKPVNYDLLGRGGKTKYTGVAKRGRVPDRIAEHLPGGKDPIPGVEKVRIRQKPSIDAAEKAEARKIRTEKPPHNKRGK